MFDKVHNFFSYITHHILMYICITKGRAGADELVRIPSTYNNTLKYCKVR